MRLSARGPASNSIFAPHFVGEEATTSLHLDFFFFFRADPDFSTIAMPKDTTATSARRGHRRHDPLHEELLETGDGGHLRKTARTKQRRTTSKDDTFVDSHLSGRILQLAKEQQDEITMEDSGAASRRAAAEFMAPGAGNLRIEDMSDEEGEEEYEEYGDSEEEEEVEEVEVDEEDMELFNRFLPGQPQEQRVSLADKILEKIAEHEAKQAGISMHPADDDTPQLPPKVIEVYMKCVLPSPLSCDSQLTSDAGWASSSRATSPANFLKPSKSSPLSATGRRSSTSRAPTNGPRTPALKPLNSLPLKNPRKPKSPS